MESDAASANGAERILMNELDIDVKNFSERSDDLVLGLGTE